MKIFLAGHKGLVGSAILKKLKQKGYKKIITANKSKLNLLNQNSVNNFLKKHKPKIVIIAAARVGGILANSIYGGQFIYENFHLEFLKKIHSKLVYIFGRFFHLDLFLSAEHT